MSKFRTTFEVETVEAHHEFKVKCLEQKSDMTTELNKFIKRFNAGQEDVNSELLTLAKRMIAHAKEGGLDTEEYESYLNHLTND